MPHSTSPDSLTSSATNKIFNETKPTALRTSIEPFPELETHQGSFLNSNGSTFVNSPSPVDRWHARKTSPVHKSGGRDHRRQKSLSDAFKTIRSRKASVSADIHEIGDALKAPLSWRLVILCIIWYTSSALTNTSSKSILIAFPKPATLTLIQFFFVSLLCVFFSWLSTVFPSLKTNIPALRHGIRYPTRDVIITTIPMAAFQIGGHLLSSTATTKIPLSLVHTIKGLSPLFTVLAYRLIFDIRYSVSTYLSLIPLTLGVMLACSAEIKGNLFGILYAFLAALIFVTQNIWSKRLFNDAAIAEASGSAQTRKLDKLNLLCYSSGLAFVITSPIWFWSEGIGILGDFFNDGSLDLSSRPGAFDHGRLALEYVFNGFFHFGQNIIAFVLLSMVSPVTYSVASLIKRVFVVVVAIVWFQNHTTNLQGFGIALTFVGLYLYDRTHGSNKADRKAKLMHIKEEPLLPLSDVPKTSSYAESSFEPAPRPYINGYALNTGSEDPKKSSDHGRVGRARGSSNSGWLPPGVRQEDTWNARGLSRSRLSVN